MRSYCNSFSVQLVVALLVIYNDLIQSSSSSTLKELFKPENEEVLQIMKEELDKFKIDMTKSFMQSHSRRKRALDGLVNDIEIDFKGPYQETTVESVGPFSTFTFANKPFLLKRDGVYQLDGLAARAERQAYSADQAIVKKGSWVLGRNQIVLNGFEWRRNFFLVTTTGNFSSIYTLHENSLQPIFRQDIHNKANAVGAEFFEYRHNLYMVILNDNEMHSTTFSPIFRWAGSYMDEIHQVQTTGASAVTTFSINSKEYIAIAQSRDYTGNTQVGTLVLGMDHLDRLERVQLLWSNGANNLRYMRTEKEHFLVITQEPEPSIVYWFGGLDFIYWQQFDSLQGKNIPMEGIQLTADEPLLIAADGDSLRFFSRSASATKIMTTWVEHKKFVDVFNSQYSSTRGVAKITNLKILKTGQTGNENVFLVITRQAPGSQMDTIRMYPVQFVKHQLSVSPPKQSGDKLSQCLQDLEKSLKNSQEALDRIEAKTAMVLTTNGNWDYQGDLASKKVIKPASSLVKSAEISPAIQRAGTDRVHTSPSQLMDNITQSNDKLELMRSQLKNVFYKSKKQNDVTGSLTFLKNVQFNRLDGADKTNLRVFSTMNRVKWEDLDNFALRKSSTKPQKVIAKWNVESLNTTFLNITNTNSKLSTENFMLKKCAEFQTLSGPFQFNNDVKITGEVKLLPETTINSIQFSDLVLKENANREIKGVKHVPFVKGKYTTGFVNNKNLQEWFASVAKVSSTGEQIFTGPVEIINMQKGQATHIEDAVVDVLNDKIWKDFEESVMLNGVDQEVEGLFKVKKLKTDNLHSKLISGISPSDLLTSDTDQRIFSNFIVKYIEIKGALTADQINGIKLSDAVSRRESQVEIYGPAALEKFQVQDVIVPDGVLIAHKDVSELASLKKVHEYSTVDGRPIFLKNVHAGSLTTTHIDNEEVVNFPSKYWLKTGDNVADMSELVLDNRKVFVSKGNFQTHKLNHFSFPDEFVSLDENQKEIILHAPVRFNRPVTSTKDVTMADGAKIQGIDLSEAKSAIVDENFKGMVRGKKTFASSIKAIQGVHIENLNGIHPVKDGVMLYSENVQKIEGLLKFDKPVKVEHVKVHEGNVDVKGLVNDVNLEEVNYTTVYKDMENRVEGDLVLEKGLTANKFSTVLLNKQSVKELLENVIYLDYAGTQEIYGHVILENSGAEFFAPCTVGIMNNIPLHDYLTKIVRLDSPSDSLIYGMKTFSNASLKNKLMCTTFNDVDLKDLNNNAFSKSKPQVITGKWSLKNANFKKNLETTKIGELSVDNIVFTNEAIEVTSPVIFKSKQTNVEGLLVDGKVNGIKFDEQMKDGIAIQGIHDFEKVIVKGNLDWTHDRPELQGLSYFFQNALTKSSPQQTISGKVTFTNGFISEKLISHPEKWLSDINLQQIQTDAVTRDAPNLKIAGQNKFTNPLTVQNSLTANSVSADVVNHLDLHKLNNETVRKTDKSGRRITGRKTLHGKLQVENLIVKDKISDILVNDLVVSNDPREINHVQFKNLDIDENMDWKSTSGVDLKSLLDERVSLTKENQELEGSYTFEELTVENGGSCSMSLINDINVKNIVTKSNIKKLSTISGQKTFKKPLTFNEGLDTPMLNNVSIHDLMSKTLRVDKPATITRPVIFEYPVIVNKDLKVETINDIQLEKFTHDTSQRISRLVQDAQNPEILSNELDDEAIKLEQITQERSVWFEYLIMKEDLTSLGVGARSKVDTVEVSNSGDVRITMHRDMDGYMKGLPKGCKCNSVVSVNLSNLYSKKRVKAAYVGVDKCLNVFNVVSPNKRSYSVISETISSNKTCVTEEDSTTKILRDGLKLSESKFGYISDAGAFSVEEDDFLVLAQYFDKNTGSHSTVTRILRVDKVGKLEEIQSVETHGARKVALNQVGDIWMLAIANSKSSMDESSCNADSAIYKWSKEQRKFLLIRTIMTDGAFDVKFITTETSNEFYKQSFVAFAQQGNSASGEIMIFRYEQPEGNFVITQTIRSIWPVTGMRTMCLCQQCFLVTVVPQEGITFYENRFVEGFQEYYKAPVFGAIDISEFKIDDQYLFAIATNRGPILAEAVMAGSCHN